MNLIHTCVFLITVGQKFHLNTDMSTSWKDESEMEDFNGDLAALQAESIKAQNGGMTRIEQLEHEMKLLNWHKLANEAALKAAIIRTKNLKQHDRLQVQRDRNRERASWMEQIIREEQMKPLEVNTHFIKEYEAKEKQADLALERTIEHHLHNLRKLKKSIEAKDKIRQRKEKFYAKREEVRARIADRLGAEKTSGPQTRKHENLSNGPESNGNVTPAMQSMVDSLGKLMKLERRINELEKNVQEKAKMERRTAGNLSQLGMLRFRKKKIEASLRSPAKTMFSVSMHPGNNPTNPGRRRTNRNDVDTKLKVNSWIKDRKTHLKLQRKKREQRTVANRKKARHLGSRNASSVKADFKNMKLNDPRQRRKSRGGSTSLPPIGGSRRRAW